MNKLVLATADTKFEQRVRAAFKGRVEGQLRYWRDGMLADDPSRLIEELGHRGAEVVALGPGIPPEAALQLARAIDHDRPDISTVIVAEPSTASTCRCAPSASSARRRSTCSFTSLG